jgi:hypothetical protein
MRTTRNRWSALAVLPALAAVLAMLLCLSAAAAAASGNPESAGAGALFSVGMGARALGMGGAFVGVADDGNAIYYNPAGLAFVEGNNITSLYSNAFGAGNYMGVGYARPNIGAALFGLVSTVQGTDGWGNPTGSFGYQEGAIAAGGAYAFGPAAIGGALKVYGQNVPDNSGYGVTGDIGAMVSLPGALDFKFGAVARNVAGSVKFESGHKDPFERVFAVGASVKPIPGLLVAADFDITNLTGRLGAEYQVIPMVALRAGANINADKAFGFSAGAGFAIHGVRIDYAYQFHPGELPDSHWISLGFSF